MLQQRVESDLLWGSSRLDMSRLSNAKTRTAHALRFDQIECKILAMGDPTEGGDGLFIAARVIDRPIVSWNTIMIHWQVHRWVNSRMFSIHEGCRWLLFSVSRRTALLHLSVRHPAQMRRGGEGHQLISYCKGSDIDKENVEHRSSN